MWVLTSIACKRLATAQRNMERAMAGVRLLDKKTNVWVRGVTKKVMPPKVNSTNSNWINFGNFSYLFIDKQLSWPEAQLECASYGSDLVSIHNEYEEELVKRLVKDARKWFWIGGLAGRSYCWSDHSMWDYIEITPRSPLGVKGCIAV
ncbi:hypothetical protein QR680_016129 [Steinernema hermaphroditum]|uniref:C-type lectin domain-containing protein n=1 Tax=Steinernema hermaphroditum TaxID=289476 RepID=A0AA39HB76_9BILA|nr:hypothetical protein QR680_016129 [Steinernema hermaphroditum]